MPILHARLTQSTGLGCCSSPRDSDRCSGELQEYPTWSLWELPISNSPRDRWAQHWCPLCYNPGSTTPTSHAGPTLLEGHCTCPRLCIKARMSWPVRVGCQECLNFIEKWNLVLATWYFNCLMLTYSCSTGLLGLSKDFGYVMLLPWQEGNLKKN